MPVRLLVTGTSRLLENQKKLTDPIHVTNLAKYIIIIKIIALFINCYIVKYIVPAELTVEPSKRPNTGLAIFATHLYSWSLVLTFGDGSYYIDGKSD